MSAMHTPLSFANMPSAVATAEHPTTCSVPPSSPMPSSLMAPPPPVNPLAMRGLSSGKKPVDVKQLTEEQLINLARIRKLKLLLAQPQALMNRGAPPGSTARMAAAAEGRKLQQLALQQQQRRLKSVGHENSALQAVAALSALSDQKSMAFVPRTPPLTWDSEDETAASEAWSPMPCSEASVEVDTPHTEDSAPRKRPRNVTELMARSDPLEVLMETMSGQD